MYLSMMVQNSNCNRNRLSNMKISGCSQMYANIIILPIYRLDKSAILVNILKRRTYTIYKLYFEFHDPKMLHILNKSRVGQPKRKFMELFEICVHLFHF